MSDQPSQDREVRAAHLANLGKRSLASIHHQGAGCLMSVRELHSWTKEELITAILESEFGNPPITTDML